MLNQIVLPAYQKLMLAAVRPYTMTEALGWGIVYKYFVGHENRDWVWKGARARIGIDKRTGYSVERDLSWWADRLSYFIGRWHDLPTQLLLDDLLEGGDCVVDVGANRGAFTLYAAHRVGPGGKVICFEANPACVPLIQKCVERNGLTNVAINAVGLSDEQSELTLTVPNGKPGEASFGRPAHDPRFTHSVTVKVALGDSILSGHRPDLVKIDVEGFECHVLRGMSSLIAKAKPLIVTEMISAHLARCGSSKQDLIGFLDSHGYTGYQICLSGNHCTWELASLESGNDSDVLWIPRLSLKTHMAAKLAGKVPPRPLQP